MRKLVCCLVVLVFICVHVLGEEKMEGLVLDSLKQPIAYATVQFEKDNQEVMTNSDGQFSIQRSKVSKDKLVVSCLGYNCVSMDVKTFKKSPLVIVLKLATVQLGEVSVNPLDARELVRQSFLKLKENVPSEFLRIQGTFKQLDLTDGQHNTYLKADVNVYMNLTATWKHWEVRTTMGRSEIFKNKSQKILFAEPAFKFYNLFLSRQPIFHQMDRYNFKVAGLLEYEGMTLLKVHFLPVKRNNKVSQYAGDIYIDQETKAVVYIDESMLPDSKLNRNILFGMSQKNELWTCKVMFQKWGNWFVPKYFIEESASIFKYRKETTKSHCLVNFFSKDYEIVAEKTLPENQSMRKLLFKSGGSDFEKNHQYSDDFILETNQEKQIKQQYGE